MGDSVPDTGLVPELCRALHLTADALLGLTDEPRVIGEFVDDEGARHRFVDGVPVGLKCTFCGKHQDQAGQLVAGPGVAICRACVALCGQILTDAEA